jgi:NAD(P)H-dependent FMN reductase
MRNPVPDDRLRLAVIIGSTRQGRFAPTVARWFASVAARRDGVVVDLIDLAEARLPDVLANDTPPEVSAMALRLASADAFVLVTPEYNHSFPAPLKSAIDWYTDEWRAKPVGFVSYGGRGGGLRAVEHLRQVFVELHAMTVRDAVSFHGARRAFDAEGQPKDGAGSERVAQAMLDQIAWWGTALREARTRRPYAA